MTSLESLEPAPVVGPRRRLARDTAALVGAQLVGLAATLALTPVQLDRMGYERYGLVSLAIAAVGVFGFLDYGLSWTVLRYVPSVRVGDRPADADEVASFVVSTALVASVLVSAAAGAVLLGAGLSGHGLLDGREPLVLCLVLLPLLATTNVLSNVARALGHFQAAAFVFGTFFLTTNVVWAVVAGRRRDVELVLGWQMLFSLAAVVFWYRLIHRAGLPRLRFFPRLSHEVRKRRPELLQFAAYSAIGGLSASLFLAADKIAFASGIGVEDLPFYAIAVALCSRIAIVASSLAGVAFPQLSAAHAADDVSEYASLSAWALRATTLCTVAVAAALFWAGPDFLELWISERFSAATDTVVRALAVGFGVQALGQLGYAANDARGRVRRTMVSGLAFGTGGVVAAGLVSAHSGLDAGAFVFAGALAAHGVVGLLLGYGRATLHSVVEAAALTLPMFLAVGAAASLAHVSGAGAAGRLAAAGATAGVLLVVQARIVLRLRRVGGAWRTVRKD